MSRGRAPAYAVQMTKTEAEAEAARRNHEPAEAGLWGARDGGADGWTLVHLAAPGMPRQRASGAHTESRARPEAPPDPRPAIIQNIPPYGGPG